MGRKRAAFVHPLADVDPEVAIGEGTRIWQFTVVKRGARIGKNCNIGSHCYIEWGSYMGNDVTVKNGVALWEGVHLSDGVFVGPNAVFTNDIYPRSPRMPEAEKRYKNQKNVIRKTHLDYGVTIGAGAMILAGITIGCFASVGLGAVATRPISPYALVAGNPARRIGWMCECGLPLPRKTPRVCSECGRQYREEKGKLRKVS